MSIVSCLLVNLVHSTQYTVHTRIYVQNKKMSHFFSHNDWLDWIGLKGMSLLGIIVMVSEWVSEILKFHILIFFLWRFFTLPRPFLFFFSFVFFFRVFLPFFFFTFATNFVLSFFCFFFFFFFSRLKSSIDFPA